jgi:putative heme-binding domain-containing protein
LAQHEYTATEVEDGGRLYQANCVRCHGATGDQVANIDLMKGKLGKSSSENDLVRIMLNGIPGTAMTAGTFNEKEAGKIAGYLRSLADYASRTASTPGDANRGKAIFEGKANCVSCHRIQGAGGRLGPDLTQVGADRPPADIERSILEPGATVLPNNRFYRVVTRDGATVTGKLLNRDSFNVLLLDSKNEQLRSFSVSNLREHAFVNSSAMPSFRGKLTAQELSDVVTYLASMKGPVKP